VANIGSGGTTSFTDAQALDGNYQTLTEVSGVGYVAPSDVVELHDSITDNYAPTNLGTYSNDANMQSDDGTMNILTEVDNGSGPPSLTIEGVYTGTSRKTTSGTITSVTVPTSSNRAMYFIVSAYTKSTGGCSGTQEEDSVVWDSAGVNEAFTNVGCVNSNNNRVSIWKLLAPSEKTATITISDSTNNWNWDGAVYGVYVLSGVHQTTSDDGFNSNSGTGTASQVTVSSAIGDLVLDGVSVRNDMTVDSSQTDQWSFQSSSLAWGGSSNETGATTVSLDWTFTSDTWAAAGISINPTESVVYEFDREFSFSGIILTNNTYEELAIKTGIIGTESLKVDIWDSGAWVNLVTIVDANDNVWINTSISSYLDATTEEFRFIGGTENSDTTQNTWEIDMVLIHTWTDEDPDYELQWEHQSQSVNTSKEMHLLTVYGYSSNASENFEIQLWNSTSSAWTSPLSISIGTTETWYNNSISGNGIIGSTITWRYRGTHEEFFDLEQTTLFIDYAGIASYDELPIFHDIQTSGSYAEGSSGNTLSWNFSDANPNSYVVYQDGVPTGDSGIWNSFEFITVNIDGLVKGSYNFTVSVTDLNGYEINNTIEVTVFDTTPPVFVTTPNQTIIEGSSGNEIQWNATDNYPATYEVYQNGTPTLDSGSWTNTDNVTISIDGLEKGLYNFTIVVIDSSNNQATNTVFITVVDTINPVFISGLNNITYSEGTTTYSWELNTTDANPDNFFVYRDSIPTGETGSWTNPTNITINVGGLTKGEYNLTIVIYDESGNMNVTTIWVHVIDTTPPTLLDSSGDITYGEGFSGNEIWWEISDNYPGNYTVYFDGSPLGIHTEVSWINGSKITIDVDSLQVNTYNYTIIFYDESGNVQNDTIWVTVVSESSAPELIEIPDDFSYFEESSGNTINWTATDDFPLIYILYQNGNSFASSSWTNGTMVSINIDGLAPGVYNFTIEFQDLSRNYIRDSLNVTVIDNIAPIFTNTPSIQEVTIGSDETLSWIANDNYPSIYEIYQNDVRVDTNNWVNFMPIEMDLKDLAIGDFNITIVFFDTSSNHAKHTILISVVIIQTNEPTLTPGLLVYEGYVDILNGAWVDEKSGTIPSAMINGSLYYQSEIGESIQEFTSPITNSLFSITFDYSSLNPGEYIWVLTFNHANYETQELNFTVNVLAHTLDIELILPANDIVPNQEYTIGIEVSFRDPELSALRLDVFGSKTGSAEGIPLNLLLDLELTNQASSLQTYSLITNADGYAEVVLTSDATSNLLGINSISVEILDQGSIQGLNYILPSADIPQVEMPTTPVSTLEEEDPGSSFDPIIIAIIGGAVLFLGVIVFLLKQRKPDEDKETIVPLSKDDIFLRLSEINSLRSVLIVNYNTGEPLLKHIFKEDEAVNAAIENILSFYDSSDTQDEFVINTADRSLNELIFFDFLQVYRTLGKSVDIIMITHGKVSQMEKSLDQISAWLHKSYDLKEKTARKSLFDQINDEIILNMHIRFGTWTMQKVVPSESLNLSKLPEAISKSVAQILIERRSASFTELVGKLNTEYEVNEIYNEIQQLMIDRYIEVSNQ
jgi:hypothetical protein